MDNTIENPVPIPDDVLPTLRETVAKAKWRTAKSAQYQGALAHQYHILRDGHEVCIALVMAIRKYGYEAPFGKKMFKYLWIDEYKYWEYDGDLVNREHRSTTQGRIAADAEKGRIR